MIDRSDPDRYVSEWDYFKAERDRDFADFDFFVKDERALIDDLAADERHMGTEYRDLVTIGDSLSLVSVAPYRDSVHGAKNYRFTVAWKRVVFDGYLRPEHDGSVQPFLEMTIASKYEHEKLVMETLPYDELDDAYEHMIKQFGPTGNVRDATNFIVEFLQALTYDLEREFKVWSYYLEDKSPPNEGVYDLGG